MLLRLTLKRAYEPYGNSTGDQELDLHGPARKGQAGRLVLYGTCRERAAKWAKNTRHTEMHTGRVVIYPRPEVILYKWTSSSALQDFGGLFWPNEQNFQENSAIRQDFVKNTKRKEGKNPSFFRHTIKIIFKLLFLFKTNQFPALSDAIRYVSCYGTSWLQQIKLGMRMASHLHEAL